MMMRSKNLAILVITLVLGGIFAVLVTIYFEVSPDNLQACTEEAMICPDGSAVARTGPNCEFTPCPSVAGDLDELNESTYPQEDYDRDKADFQFRLQEAVRSQIGQPIEDYEPQMFMQVFPGLKPTDFDGVEAQIGFYKHEDGELIHEIGDVQLIHSAAPAITEAGMDTLLANVTYRMGYDIPHYASVDEVVEYLLNEEAKPPIEPEEPVACTMDAKACPDGSYVGRTGPNCEFEACPAPPSSNPIPAKTITCSPQSKKVNACIEIYQPVCGLVQVQCVTTPCYPQPQTFSNGCDACRQQNVISYTTGECELTS